MKLNCGLSSLDKWRALQEWHRFFAIWPRRVGKYDCRSLEFLERRLVILGHGGYTSRRWEYRSL